MEHLNSISFNRWFFIDFIFIGDLIQFEGSPILVHYRNDSRHALYYWVEGDNRHNRWLCFEVTVMELYNYLYQHDSLRELISKKEKEPFYTVDIDANLRYENFQMIPGYLIPEKYFPDIESFFSGEITDYYEELFAEDDLMSGTGYVELMVTKAGLGFKISPREPRRINPTTSNPYYDGTVSVANGAYMLRNLDASVKKYTGIEFVKKYANDFPSQAALEKQTELIIQGAELRIGEAKKSSFAVSFFVDKLLYKDYLKKEYVEFSDTVIENYKADVLSIDLNNETQVKALLERYNDKERAEIFTPLMNVINHNEYDLTIIDKTNNYVKRVEKVNPVIKRRIAPKTPPVNDLPEPLKKVFMTITLDVFENQNIKTITKRDLEELTLFTTISDQVTRELQKIQTDKYILYLHKPITIIIKHVGNEYEIIFEPLNISVKNPIQSIAFDKFLSAFDNIIEADYLGNPPSNLENKDYLFDIIEDYDIIDPDPLDSN